MSGPDELWIAGQSWLQVRDAASSTGMCLSLGEQPKVSQSGPCMHGAVAPVDHGRLCCKLQPVGSHFPYFSPSMLPQLSTHRRRGNCETTEETPFITR